MSEVFTLYEYPSSGNCYKIRLLANQLGIPYNRYTVDILRGESRAAKFMRRFPNGKVPAVEFSDGKRLTESNAIIWYLARTQPGGNKLLPDDDFVQAQILQWLSFEQYQIETNLAVARFWLSIKNEPDGCPDLATKQENGARALGLLNSHLTQHDYLVGDYSIADIGIYAYSHLASEAGVTTQDYPSLEAWFERVQAQPGFVSLEA